MVRSADIVQAPDTWIDHPHGLLFARSWLGTGAEKQGDQAGAPIVLFHDSLGCVALWRDFPAQLAAATGRRVIAYDRLGFGRSDARSDVLSVDFIDDEARTYFPSLQKQLGFRKFIAFGHSVGGGMAAHCAAKFKDDCVALITESAQAFVEDRTLAGITEAKEQFKDEQQLARLNKYHGDKSRWVVDAWTETWLSPAFASWSLVNVLPEVKCPLLAIHGEHDEYGSIRHPQLIQELAGGSTRVEIIANTFHVPHRERAELIIELVSAFLSRLAAIRAD